MNTILASTSNSQFVFRLKSVQHDHKHSMQSGGSTLLLLERDIQLLITGFLCVHYNIYLHTIQLHAVHGESGQTRKANLSSNTLQYYHSLQTRQTRPLCQNPTCISAYSI